MERYKKFMNMSRLAIQFSSDRWLRKHLNPQHSVGCEIIDDLK